MVGGNREVGAVGTCPKAGSYRARAERPLPDWLCCAGGPARPFAAKGVSNHSAARASLTGVDACIRVHFVGNQRQKTEKKQTYVENLPTKLSRQHIQPAVGCTGGLYGTSHYENGVCGTYLLLGASIHKLLYGCSRRCQVV